jgi:tryptophan-rich sensory protein
MGLVLAILFLIVGIAALVAYNGTPHGGPTDVCSPINFLNHSYSIDTDCRYVSIGELAIVAVFFFATVLAILVVRTKTRVPPKRPPIS